MEELKDILDNLNESVIRIDGNGQVVLFNNEALRIQKSIAGTPLLLGGHFTALVGEHHSQTFTDIIKTVKRQKKPIKNFAEYQTASGSTVSLEYNFVPVLGIKRELRYINIITQDITSRRLFERNSRTAAADFRNLLEHAQAVIFSVDSRGYIVEWNTHCAEITGFRKDEVLSQKMCDAVISRNKISIFQELMDHILKNESVGKIEFPLLKKDGGEATVMVSATPRTNANGQVIGATLVGQDISELTAYRKSLEQLVENKTEALQKVLKKEKEAVEMKNRFVSIASHEFRSPLSSIDFAANFIKRNAATIGSKKLNEKVRVIEKHVSYMNHLLEDVLTFSKNEKGRIKLLPTHFSLDDFVKDAVQEVADSTRHSHHICVSTNSLGCLVTDEKLLRNVLINLLTNAIKFSPGKDEISLNVLDHDAFITLEVRDEGIGIPDEEIDLIFEPFIRGKKADPIQGTGLGLSIVKKAVELLNGTIQVESVLGRGSVFTVTIPREMVLTGNG
ncbi:MAG: ATP-binding protein [Chryseosolibacter sp.]